MAGARVIPFPRGRAVPVVEIVAPTWAPSAAAVERAKLPCPVCAHAVGFDAWHCNTCETRMCEPCYWGRVASLDEWRDYLTRWIEAETMPTEPVPVRCPACRQSEVLR